MPAPTVRPPSRIAKRKPSSKATGIDEFHIKLHIVAGHDHLDVRGQSDDARDIRRSEVELRAITRSEGGMASAFFFAQDIDLSAEFGVGLDRPWLSDDMPSAHFPFVHSPQQQPHIVAGLGFVQDLAEHLNGGNDGAARFGGEADDFHFLAGFQNTSLHSPRDDGAAPSDAEDIFYGHQEGHVCGALRQGDVFVHGVNELPDCPAPLAFPLTAPALVDLQGAPSDDRDFIAGELILVEQLPHFQFHQVNQFRVIHHVRLVDEDDDGGDADLPCQQGHARGFGASVRRGR
jgi:hypothetical protein